MSDKLRFSVY